MKRWQFKTRNFTVELHTTREEILSRKAAAAALNDGLFVAFDSEVRVYWRGDESESPIGSDSLGGSVYAADSIDEFWTGHRDSNPANRNCSIMRASEGANVSICHYFPDMVKAAIAQAREEMLSRKAAAAALPYVRESV